MGDFELNEEEQSLVELLFSNNLNDVQLGQIILGTDYFIPERKKAVIDYVQSKMQLF